MVMKKKAVFFTFIAILLLAILLLSFSIFSTYRLRARSLVIETRVITMDSFIKDLEKDINRGLFISSHRSILTLVQYVTSTGNFLDNSTEQFYEVIFNGTVNGEEQGLIQNTTFPDWMEKMQVQGRQIDLIINFSLQRLEIGMLDPWHVGIDTEIQILIEDMLGVAQWNTSRNVTASVSIMGFEDPIYAVKTDAKVFNVINETPFEDFVVNNDTANLQLHANNSYYVAQSTAPDFLMRLEGNFNASPQGIESMINLQKLDDQGIELQARSAVDHIYWSNKAVASYYIDGMPSWFMMDDEYNNETGQTHLEFYEVDGLIS